MDPRLQEMLDHHEITRTLTEYCHGCDRCDEAHMGSVYTEDSWDDHGHIKASGAEFARVMTASVLESTDTLAHLLGQSMINVNGDKAGAETYFLAVSCDTREDGSRACNQLGGRYVDKLQRVDGRWLIKERIVVRDWTISLPLEQEWLSATSIQPGHRSNADPSYATLGLVHGDVDHKRSA